MNFKQTLDTISRFTNTAVLSPGQTFFTDSASTLFGLLKTPEIELAQEVGLYDNISDLARILSLFESPEISQDGFNIKISQDGSNASFLTSDIALVRRNNFNVAEQIQKTLDVPVVLEIEMDEQAITKIKQAANTIANSSVQIRSDESSIQFIIRDVDVINSSSNSYSFSLPATTTKLFDITLTAEMFNKMPKGGFKFKLCYSSAANSFRAVFEQPELTIITPTTNNQ